VKKNKTFRSNLKTVLAPFENEPLEHIPEKGDISVNG
jgi:hypothetical protein